MVCVDPTTLGQYVSMANGCCLSSFFPTLLEPCLERGRFKILRRVVLDTELIGSEVTPDTPWHARPVVVSGHQSLIGV